MTDDLETTLRQVRSGELSVAAAVQHLRSWHTPPGTAAPTPPGLATPTLPGPAVPTLPGTAVPTLPGTAAPTADLGFANIDLDRERRCGFPEVVYCPGKSVAEVVAIAEEILHHADRALLTRANPDQAEAVTAAIPSAVFDQRSGCIAIDPEPLPKTGLVAILAAGTSDAPVAEEAARTASIMGAAVTSHRDVGIAGLHRLLDRIDEIREARVIVAIAGMEGALASVVGGLVDRPVIAVPTSAGCGFNLDGVVPLLAMLNSCAAGVGVVNVDNGFGAGYLAALINRMAAPK